MQRLLNFFYYQNTPYRDEFIAAEMLPCQVTEQPEMGLPTPEDPNQKKSTLAILKERDRLGKLNTDNPQWMHLIECFANLVSCYHVEIPEGINQGHKQAMAKYQTTDLQALLTQQN